MKAAKTVWKPLPRHRRRRKLHSRGARGQRHCRQLVQRFSRRRLAGASPRIEFRSRSSPASSLVSCDLAPASHFDNVCMLAVRIEYRQRQNVARAAGFFAVAAVRAAASPMGSAPRLGAGSFYMGLATSMSVDAVDTSSAKTPLSVNACNAQRSLLRHTLPNTAYLQIFKQFIVAVYVYCK